MIPTHQTHSKPTDIPTIMRNIFRNSLIILVLSLLEKKMCINGGKTIIATKTDEISAKVFVNARGLNSFPSAPDMTNTGRNATTVVLIAVKIAPLTSFAPR